MELFMEIKYDLEIVLPVCFDGKYKDRLNDFKKYGLYNINPDHKVLLTILYGTEELLAEYQEGWPKEIDIRWLSAPLNQVAAKVYHYYSTLDTLDNVRWFMRIDDDSCTNVEFIMNFLNNQLDHMENYYLTTEMYDGETFVEQNLLRELNLDRCLYTLMHEVEASIMSQAAVKKILNNPDSKKYINERAKIEAGYTDMCMAYAARLAKILPNESHIISQYPHILELFAGKVGHIHKLAHDINPMKHNLLKNYIDSPPYFNGRTFIFYKMGQNNLPEFMHPIRLLEKGKVLSQHELKNCQLWYFDKVDFILMFLNSAYMPVVQFKIEDMNFSKVQGLWATVDRTNGTSINVDVLLQEFIP